MELLALVKTKCDDMRKLKFVDLISENCKSCDFWKMCYNCNRTFQTKSCNIIVGRYENIKKNIENFNICKDGAVCVSAVKLKIGTAWKIKIGIVKYT